MYTDQVIRHQQPRKKSTYALAQYAPTECLLQPGHLAKPYRAEGKFSSLRTRSRCPNEELTGSQRATHNVPHSFIQQLFTEHLVWTRKRAKGQKDKEGKQEPSLGLPAKLKNTPPHTFSLREATHPPRLTHFEVQILLTVKGAQGLTHRPELLGATTDRQASVALSKDPESQISYFLRHGALSLSVLTLKIGWWLRESCPQAPLGGILTQPLHSQLTCDLEDLLNVSVKWAHYITCLIWYQEEKCYLWGQRSWRGHGGGQSLKAPTQNKDPSYALFIHVFYLFFMVVKYTYYILAFPSLGLSLPI